MKKLDEINRNWKNSQKKPSVRITLRMDGKTYLYGTELARELIKNGKAMLA